MWEDWVSGKTIHLKTKAILKSIIDLDLTMKKEARCIFWVTFDHFLSELNI